MRRRDCYYHESTHIEPAYSLVVLLLVLVWNTERESIK
jgi:hypothetical protein